MIFSKWFLQADRMILLPMCPFVEPRACFIHRWSPTRWVLHKGLVRLQVQVGLDYLRTVATFFLTGWVHVVHLFGLELAEHIHAVFAEECCWSFVKNVTQHRNRKKVNIPWIRKVSWNRKNNKFPFLFLETFRIQGILKFFLFLDTCRIRGPEWPVLENHGVTECEKCQKVTGFGKGLDQENDKIPW